MEKQYFHFGGIIPRLGFFNTFGETTFFWEIWGIIGNFRKLLGNSSEYVHNYNVIKKKKSGGNLSVDEKNKTIS